MKCYAFTASLILFLTLPVFLYAESVDPKTTGTNAANSALGKFGTKEGIKSNAVNPIMSSNTPMNTIDNSQSFNAQLLCPSSNKYLEVFVQPGGSGDLSSVIINQDTDMNGSFDYALPLPFLVSGVCGNGVISCNAGTWSGCRHYKWAADAAGRVSYQDAAMTDLGGCYCINNNCGNNLVWTNLAFILKDLGGGIAGAIQATNPQYAISDVKIDGTLISYYGQKSGSCSNAGGGSGPSDPQKYYSNWALLNADKETQTMAQAADPDSYYNLITTSVAAQQNPHEMLDCSLKRNLFCSMDPANLSYAEDIVNLCSQLETKQDCKLKEEKADGVRVYSNFNPTNLSPIASCQEITCNVQAICNNDTIYNVETYDGGHSVTDACNGKWLNRDGNGEWVVSFMTGVHEYCCTDGGYPGTTFPQPGAWGCTDDWCGYGPTTFPCNRVSTPDHQYNVEGVVGNAITVTLNSSNRNGYVLGTSPFYIVIENQNGALVATLDGRYNTGNNLLIYNVAQTGTHTVKIWQSLCGSSICNSTNYTNIKKITCPLDPSLSCTGAVFGESKCEAVVTHNVCHEWWQKDRTYMCQINPWDFSDIQKRAEKVTSTAKDNTTSMYYQDLRKDESGNWISEEMTTTLNVKDSYSECEKACKVRRPKADTQASVTGHTAQVKTNTQSFDFFYKPCPQNTCPAGVGEEIVKDCQCINEFGDAMGVMLSLRAASQDMVCTDGVAKPLQ